MKRKIAALCTFIIVMASAGLCSADMAHVKDTLSNARKQGRIVVVEIGTAGCIGCDEMEPVIEKLRTDYKDRLEVLVIDVREDTESPRLLGARSIPTQIFMDKDGKEFHRHMGFYSYEKIAALLKKNGLSGR